MATFSLPAKDVDEWNLNPTVTYRHVLSQSTGVHNALSEDLLDFEIA